MAHALVPEEEVSMRPSELHVRFQVTPAETAVGQPPSRPSASAVQVDT